MPSGLTLYWLTNNILTTAQQVYLKSTAKLELAPAPTFGTIVNPKVPASAMIDAKPSGAESNARRSRGEKFRANQASAASVASAAGVRGKKGKGDKFKARKEQETMVSAGTDEEGNEIVVAEQRLMNAEESKRSN